MLYFGVGYAGIPLGRERDAALGFQGYEVVVGPYFVEPGRNRLTFVEPTLLADHRFVRFYVRPEFRTDE